MNAAIVVAFLLTLAGGPQTPAQTASSTAAPTLAEAQARLQANDPAGAVKLLEIITKATPADVSAWRLLGTAYRRTKDADRALSAYRKTLELEPESVQAFYDLGTAYALKREYWKDLH